MPMRNKVKQLVDDRNLSVYEFRKQTGIANKTAYDLYNHPGQYPNKNVMEAICRTFNVQPADVIEYVKND